LILHKFLPKIAQIYSRFLQYSHRYDGLPYGLLSIKSPLYSRTSRVPSQHRDTITYAIGTKTQNDQEIKAVKCNKINLCINNYWPAHKNNIFQWVCVFDVMCVYICGAVCGILIKVASFDFFPTTGIQTDKCFAL